MWLWLLVATMVLFVVCGCDWRAPVAAACSDRGVRRRCRSCSSRPGERRRAERAASVAAAPHRPSRSQAPRTTGVA